MTGFGDDNSVVPVFKNVNSGKSLEMAEAIRACLALPSVCFQLQLKELLVLSVPGTISSRWMVTRDGCGVIKNSILKSIFKDTPLKVPYSKAG